jgi:hypothetical protein
MDKLEKQNDLPTIIYSLIHFQLNILITLWGCIHKRPIHNTIDDTINVYGIATLPDWI